MLLEKFEKTTATKTSRLLRTKFISSLKNGNQLPSGNKGDKLWVEICRAEKKNFFFSFKSFHDPSN